MKKPFYISLFQVMVIMFACVFSFSALSQDTLTKKMPAPVQQNAGFDVIILKNGDLVYGLVKEVGLTEVRYQRTDIPDGPVYVLLRSEIYVISYRNQVKDILNPPGSTVFAPLVVDTPKLFQPVIIEDTAWQQGYSDTTWNFDEPLIQYRQKAVLVGLGFIRSFTKVDNADDYATSASFPTLSFAYEMQKSQRLRMGLQVAVGSHKFNRQEFSAYDNAQKDIFLKENIFTLHAYGKYNVSSVRGNFRPYLMAGLGIHSSYLRSEYTLRFVNNPNQAVFVKSGSQSVSLGGLLRAGTNYFINNQVQLFADAGIGPAVFQIGAALQIDQFKNQP